MRESISPLAGQTVGRRGGTARPAPQALLSSTFAARGLMVPVRFTWEAAKGASCRVTAPRPGFSSTRGFAFGQITGQSSYPHAADVGGYTAPLSCS